MRFLCNLFGHKPAKAMLENQGFQFTRCTRCKQDLVRSQAKGQVWKSVPQGFRVEWRNVDMRAFDQPNWFSRCLQGVTLAGATLGAAGAMLWWGTGDVVRGVHRRGGDAVAATRRVIRIGSAQARPRWNVSVQIHVDRAPRRNAVNDIGYAPGRRIAA